MLVVIFIALLVVVVVVVVVGFCTRKMDLRIGFWAGYGVMFS
jgi:hypothetical protein